MDIYINEEKINYKLENEKNTFDIVKRINESIKRMKDGINQSSMIFDSKDEKIIEHKNNFLNNCEKLNNFFNDVKINDKTDKIKINTALTYLKDLDNSLNNIKNWLIKNFKIPNTEYIIITLDNLINEIEKIVQKMEK